MGMKTNKSVGLLSDAHDCFREPLPTEGQISGHRIPWKYIDENIRGLVAEMNRLPGIETLESCGGHVDNLPYQNEEGHWIILFKVAHTEEGWRSLEFLTWAFRDMNRGGYRNQCGMDSAPPHLNHPGKTLYFYVEGWYDPDTAARFLWEWQEEGYYIPVGEEHEG